MSDNMRPGPIGDAHDSITGPRLRAARAQLATQHRGESLLAGILAYGVLESSDAQAISFLAHAERLTVDEWAEILATARELCARRLPSLRRLRDAIAMDEPSAIGLLANQRIAVIARTLEQELRAQNRDVAGVVRFADAVVTELTAASYALERRDELGAADVAQLYAPFEAMVPLALMG
jgi:hypothetical protein